MRLLAWEGLGLNAGVAVDRAIDGIKEPEARSSSSREQQDAEDLALAFVALASFPRLCPQLVSSLTGQDPAGVQFEQRWQRLQQRLLRMIRSAAAMPKERVTLHPKAQPSVR